MGIEAHPSFPSIRDQRDMLIACADRCDRYWSEPAAAFAIAAAVVNELWPDDQTRRSLCMASFMTTPSDEPLSASERFTLAAFEVHQLLGRTTA